MFASLLRIMACRVWLLAMRPHTVAYFAYRFVLLSIRPTVPLYMYIVNSVDRDVCGFFPFLILTHLCSFEPTHC